MSDATREAETRAILVRDHFYPDCSCDACFFLGQLDEARNPLRAAPDASDQLAAERVAVRIYDLHGPAYISAIADELSAIRTTSYRDGYDAAKRAASSCILTHPVSSVAEHRLLEKVAHAVRALNPDPPVSK